jgi:DNA-binding response OmpR family regulator
MCGKKEHGLMSELPRILIAEDEMLVCMALEDMLEELGYQAEIASTLEAAIQAAKNCSCVAALLDLHLHGETVEPVADILEQRSIPFAVMSGMDVEDMRSPLSNAALLQKPYVFEELRSVLLGLTRRRSSRVSAPVTAVA